MVPFVKPEKYASAIAQKNMFPPGTSTNGSVSMAPEQVPVSARRLFEVMVNTKASMSTVPARNRTFGDIGFFSHLLLCLLYRVRMFSIVLTLNNATNDRENNQSTEKIGY